MLKRREFNILLGISLTEALLGQTLGPTQDNHLTTLYNRYSSLYPLASDQFSYSEKTFKFANTVTNINEDRFCLVNFEFDSQHERFQMIDRHGILQLSSLCSHGINSGNNSAFNFSNIENSFTSSLGVFVSGSHYVGHFGPSINLHGVSQTNSLAFSRRIVMHGADYCGYEHIEKHGFLGRSLGCIAIPKKTMVTVFQKLKPGTLIFAKIDKKRTSEPLALPTAEEKKENRIK